MSTIGFLPNWVLAGVAIVVGAFILMIATGFQPEVIKAAENYGLVSVPRITYLDIVPDGSEYRLEWFIEGNVEAIEFASLKVREGTDVTSTPEGEFKPVECVDKKELLEEITSNPEGAGSITLEKNCFPHFKPLELLLEIDSGDISTEKHLFGFYEHDDVKLTEAAIECKKQMIEEMFMSQTCSSPATVHAIKYTLLTEKEPEECKANLAQYQENTVTLDDCPALNVKRIYDQIGVISFTSEVCELAQYDNIEDYFFDPSNLLPQIPIVIDSQVEKLTACDLAVEADLLERGFIGTEGPINPTLASSYITQIRAFLNENTAPYDVHAAYENGKIIVEFAPISDRGLYAVQHNFKRWAGPTSNENPVSPMPSTSALVSPGVWETTNTPTGLHLFTVVADMPSIKEGTQKFIPGRGEEGLKLGLYDDRYIELYKGGIPDCERLGEEGTDKVFLCNVIDEKKHNFERTRGSDDPIKETVRRIIEQGQKATPRIVSDDCSYGGGGIGPFGFDVISNKCTPEEVDWIYYQYLDEAYDNEDEIYECAPNIIHPVCKAKAQLRATLEKHGWVNVE